MAQAAIRFFAERMTTLLVQSEYDHQRTRSGEIVVPFEWVKGLHHHVVTAGTEADHRNSALAIVRALHPGVDRVWIVDTDEFYFDADFDRLKAAVEFEDAGYWLIKRYAYWKGVNWRIDPVEPTPAVFCVNPRRNLAFLWGRVCGEVFPTATGKKSGSLVEGIYQHHLTAVRSDAELEQKWKVFHHATEQVPGWFERVWKGWVPGAQDLHPTHPSAWKQAIPVSIDDLPESVRPHFEKWSYSR